MSLWSKLRGTTETILQIGLGGPQWNNNAGNIEARNAANSSFVIGRGATPVAANDWATKAYVDSGATVEDGGIQTIRFAITTAAAQNSVTVIPSAALITDCYISIVTPYSAGATITVGNATSPAQLMATTDNLATAAGVYSQGDTDTLWTGPNTVLVTIAGSPSAGAGFVVVKYVQAPQP